MRSEWTAMSALLCACAGAQVAQPTIVQREAAPPPVAVQDIASEKGAPEMDPPQMKAKTVEASEPPTCTPSGTAAKVVSHDSSATESADTGVGLIFEIAGISLEFPACTPDADVRVITTSWETQQRPIPSHIDPKFTRHAATLRVDHSIIAREAAPILVRLHAKHELSKPGEKLVLAVENSGECDEAHRRDKLDDGGCSHWQLFDTHFDSLRSEMVAMIPATGGYRLQFGWVPAK